MIQFATGILPLFVNHACVYVILSQAVMFCPHVVRSKKVTNFYRLGLSHSQYQTLSSVKLPIL